MAQLGKLDGSALRTRIAAYCVRRSIEIGLLGALGALGLHTAAHAANCVYTSSQLASSRIAPDGVLLIKTRCSGELPDCAKAPALVVKHGDTQVKGSVEIIHQTRSALWVAFRPDARWQVGQYTVGSLPRSWEEQTDTFEVNAVPASFSFDEALVTLSLAAGLEPVGERVCCPSAGEGSCELACGGADGERHVAVVRAAFPRTPDSVVWRFSDAEAKHGSVTIDGSVQFASARERYCVKVSAWDTYDNTTHAFERCVDAGDAKLGEVGRVDTAWSAMHLETCSAPPIIGGYGFDVWGVPRVDAPPEVAEPLRKAFCAAKRKTCGLPAQYAPDAGFNSWCSHSPAECPCLFTLHYCPEFASEPKPSAQEPDASVPDASAEAGSPAPEPSDDEGDSDESTPARAMAGGEEVQETEVATNSDKPKDGCSLAGRPGRASTMLWAMLALGWCFTRRRRALRANAHAAPRSSRRSRRSVRSR